MSSRVYVGGIPYETRERDLENFFRGYGRIRDVLIKNGYGFVEFDDYRDAEDAVYELHGKKLLGMRVSVEMARGRPRGRDQEWFSSRDRRPPRGGGRSGDGPPVRTNYRIFVENLSSGVSWQDLKDYLRPAGEVTFADAHKKYKNEGIVEFASYDDMKNAIRKFDDTTLNGRRIRLVEDKSGKKSRSRSRSRSKSKSKSRSRSSSAASRKRRTRSRSKSAGKKEKKPSRSRSRSRSAEKERVRSKSRSVSKRKSTKRSRSRSESRSPEKRFKDKSRSRSRSHSKSKSRSRSAEPKKSRTRSRSRS